MATVKKGVLFCYGSVNKAWIKLNKGQRWKVIAEPGRNMPWYTLKRGGVVIDVMQGEFQEYFEVEL